MDTGTHFIMGLSLAGLAHIDPIVNQESTLSQAILIGTIIGSQAPDFDGITKIFTGSAGYIKHHRGITHSLPAIFLWPTLISLLILIYYPSPFLFHVWIWTFFAVLTHVVLDLLNTYGTQILYPFTRKRYSLNILNIFDPFLFTIHSISILIWSFNRHSFIYIFTIVYLITIFYCCIRAWIHIKTKIILQTNYNLIGKLSLFPSIRWGIWNIIEELPEQYNIGIIKEKNLLWIETKMKEPVYKSIEASKEDIKIMNLLQFTKYAYPERRKTSMGYDIIWIDLKYRFRNYFTLIVIVTLDDDYNILKSSFIWRDNNQIKRGFIPILKTYFIK